MTLPGLVIFDCDGVLVDSEPVSERVFVEAAAHLGIDISQAEVSSRYLGTSDASAFRDLAQRYDMVLPDDFFERLERAKLAAYARGVSTIPGSVHAVKGVVGAGVLACVATSGTFAETTAKLGHSELQGLFGERVFTASMVSHGKPAPDLFLYAAEQMGVPTGATVVVEDSAMGVRGAVEAGMRVLGYAPRGDMLGLSDLGAETFVSMADVPGLLGI